MMRAASRAIFEALGDISPEERQRLEKYFNSFSDTGRYAMVKLDENGNVVKDADGNAVTEEVSGLTVKGSMLNVIRESLPEAQRQKAGRQIEAETGTSPEAGKRTEQLDKLETDLSVVQGVKLAEVEEAKKKGDISPTQAEAKSEEINETFGEARRSLRVNREMHSKKELWEERANAAPEAMRAPADAMVKDAEKATTATEKAMQKSLEEVRQLMPEAADAPVKERGQEVSASDRPKDQGIEVSRADAVASNISADLIRRGAPAQTMQV
jgi:hypothetical protein